MRDNSRLRALGRTLFAAASLAVFVAVAPAAHAQPEDPDVRNIQPSVMLIVDTSGSMERLPACTCTTQSCAECLPDCSLPNTIIDGSNPLTGTPPPGKKNRWGVALEALTGRFHNFECNALTRTSANGATYDLGEALPYHQPWACGGAAPCVYPGTPTTPIQADNGILDTWGSSFRFGLMTFDGMDTYRGAPPLVEYNAFSDGLSEGENGMWSYGGKKRFRYPTCENWYAMDTGVRGPDAAEGGLVAPNSNICANPPCDPLEINASIQEALLRARPYGGTPIAAALDDLYEYYKNDTSDTFAGCRDRYAMLITDGQPDLDYRDHGCDCQTFEECRGADPLEFDCPYPEPRQAAYNLVHGRGQDDPNGMIRQLFVIGISIGDDQAVKTELNMIAESGGSTPAEDGNAARFADDLEDLETSLNDLLERNQRAVARTVPVFVTSPTTGAQYEISTGLLPPFGPPKDGVAQAWKGIIERRRVSCEMVDGVATQVIGDLTNDDLLHKRLDSQSARRLRTAIPAAPVTSADMNGRLDRLHDSARCGAACAEVDLSNTGVPNALFGLGDSQTLERMRIVDWMYGRPGSVRDDHKLGDIFHSTPVIVAPPRADSSVDEAYPLFADRVEVRGRPLTMIFGTNDGILHGVAIEDFTGNAANGYEGKAFDAGEEMWGFVPPYMLDKLGDQLTSHQYGVDGTPILKDVFFSRPAGSTGPMTGGDFHTVLIVGLRGGGNAYVALDVTDPTEPVFLWQFTDPQMGEAFGQPAFAQVEVEWESEGDTTLQQRAVAILPGGMGVEGPGGPHCESLRTRAMVDDSGENFDSYPDPVSSGTPLDHRSEVRCWEARGRALYFVDVETGKLIKKLAASAAPGPDVKLFPSPITGTPVVYPDAVGALATEGFVLDADGVLWRFDLNDNDPRADENGIASATEALEGWTARPFHDLYWGQAADAGMPWFERPILSLDEQSRLVILLGTGDISLLDNVTASNRVVSLTQFSVEAEPSEPEDYLAAVNWEVREGPGDLDFVPSEQVTGSMALFQGQLFFASFASVTGSDPCNHGKGRLWSVHFTDRGNAPNANNRTYPPRMIPAGDPDDPLFNIELTQWGRDDMIIAGLGTTQRASCNQAFQDEEDDLINSYFSPGGLKALAADAAPSIWVMGNMKRQLGDTTSSQLSSVQVNIARPRAFNRVTSWASSTD